MSMDVAWQRLKDTARALSKDGGVPDRRRATDIVRRILQDETPDFGDPPDVAIEFLAGELIALVAESEKPGLVTATIHELGRLLTRRV